MATIADIILQVREVLQDLDGDRYSDERIIRAINLGILDLRRVRADYFIGRFAEPTFQAELPSDVYPLTDFSLPAIVKYAAGWVETSDDEYVSDGHVSE
jgi:hypothetical protein